MSGQKNWWQEEPPGKTPPIWHRNKTWKHGHRKSATATKNVLTPKIFYYSLHQPLTQVLPFSGSQLSHRRNERPELDQLRLVTFLSYVRPPSISWWNPWTLLPGKHTLTNFDDFKEFINLDLELHEILSEDKKMVWRGEKKRRNEWYFCQPPPRLCQAPNNHFNKRVWPS